MLNKSDYTRHAYHIRFFGKHFMNVFFSRFTKPPLFYWGWVFVAFGVVHFTDDFLPLGGGVRKTLFWIALLGISIPIWQDLRTRSPHIQWSEWRKYFVGGALLTAALAVLVWNLESSSMGTVYAERARAPFLQPADWYNKRLLMPVFANLLGLVGDRFYLFSTIVFFGFNTLLVGWLSQHTKLASWQTFSLATSSFVLYQHMFPGYPDALMGIFFLIAMWPNQKQDVRLIALTLALLTHEVSAVPGIFIAWRFLDRQTRWQYIGTVALYGVIWLTSFGFEVGALVAVHGVHGKPGWLWALENPSLLTLGWVISYKLMWLFIALGAIYALIKQEWRDALFIVGTISAALGLGLLAVDVSRLAGFGFPALLVALPYAISRMRANRMNILLSIIFAGNLLLPSFYVGLNSGILLRPGLYEQLYWLMVNGKLTIF